MLVVRIALLYVENRWEKVFDGVRGERFRSFKPSGGFAMVWNG